MPSSSTSISSSAGKSLDKQFCRPLVALIYREKLGCRQYPFATLQEVSRWVGRKPYSLEVLHVYPVIDRKLQPDFVCHASAVVLRLKTALVGGGL